MKTSILILILFSLNTYAKHTDDKKTDGGNAEDVKPMVADIFKVICKPDKLFQTLANIAIEDWSKTIAKLDDTLRKKYKFQETELIEADRLKMMGEAITGTEKIRDQFIARMGAIRNLLKTDPNPYMKALDKALEPHVKAVTDEYEKDIKHLKAQKEDTSGKDKFTGLPCPTCHVAFSPLRKGLKANKLDRGSERDEKDCPKE